MNRDTERLLKDIVGQLRFNKLMKADKQAMITRIKKLLDKDDNK